MDGFRIARVILTIVPAAIDLISHGRRGLGLYETLDVWWRARKDRMSRLYRRYGPILTTMANMIPEVLDIVGGIDKVLTGTDDDAKEFKQSLSSNLNMIAVAGAIIAQVAITGLALDGIDDVHWTASAFFVASLIMGVLSVYASFIILTELNNLIGANEIRQWLSIPGPLLRHNAEDQAEALTSVNDAELQSPRRTASLAAAMILASPAGILNLALLSFIISLGIYLGCSYSADLKPGLGSSGSLGILIFYIVSTLFGLYQYSFPAALKSVESVVFGVIRWQEIKQQERRTKRRGVINNQGSTESLPGARAGTIGITPASAAMHQRGYNGRDGVGLSSPYPVRDQGLLQQMLSSTPPSGPSMDEFREALKSYIEAQEASAQRGRALLDILTRMPQPTSE